MLESLMCKENPQYKLNRRMSALSLCGTVFHVSVSRYSSCVQGICDVDCGFKYDIFIFYLLIYSFNRLTPNDPYMGRTALLTSKRCILYIYSTNTGTEYFKCALYSPFFFFSSKCSLFHNANLFGSVLFTFYIQGVLKLKITIPVPKG